MLKYRYATKAEIPAGLESHYEERDGAFFLKIEGVVPREKLDEFRDRNVTLERELKDLKAKFDGVDPEEAKNLAGLKRELEDKKLKEKDLDRVLEERVAAVKKELQGKLDVATQTVAARDTELARLRISEAAVSEAMKLGLRGEAKDDLIARAASTFKLVDGRVVAYEAGTDRPRYNGQGEAYSVGDFVRELAEKNGRHLFNESAGSGATGTTGGGAGAGGRVTGPNPWLSTSYNLTQQGKILSTNPKEAIRLAAEAGVTLPDGV